MRRTCTAPFDCATLHLSRRRCPQTTRSWETSWFAPPLVKRAVQGAPVDLGSLAIQLRTEVVQKWLPSAIASCVFDAGPG